MNHGIDFSKNVARLKSKPLSERKQLRYKKLVAIVVKKILLNNSAYLSNNDIKEISINTYNRYNRVVHQRVRSMLNNEIVKQDVNNELQRILTDAGFDKNKLRELYQNAEKYANEKKDGNLLLKIADKIEKANNLTNNGTVNVSQTQTIDYSNLDSEGQPLVTTKRKITETVSLQDVPIKNTSQDENGNAKTE